MIRTITGISCASAFISIILYGDTSGSVMYLFGALLWIVLYYGSVWVTYLCAGYVNDTMKYKVMKSLARFHCETVEKQQEVRDLILKIPFGFTGFYVSGVPMTFNMALTVGSVILSVITAFTKLHNGCSR